MSNDELTTNNLGNCPKYLNRKTIIACLPNPTLVTPSLPLPAEAVALIASADLLFLTASSSGHHLSTNIRGGPVGFLRLLTNTASQTQLVYPEYSGNRLYQTLGNLSTTPLAGIVVPDFHTGNVLYATCTTEILTGKAAAELMPHSNLAVILTLTEAKFIKEGLPFRADDGEPSPYNPPVRPLASEKIPSSFASPTETSISATLVARTMLSPDIARLSFEADDEITWTPGQHVALSLESELSSGYSHMRDDDPRSLNDDFIRTFTVSSKPPKVKGKRFEVTVRNVGVVTGYLMKANARAGVVADLKGFGGEFKVEGKKEGEGIGFVAGGIGITPLIPQVSSEVVLFWSVSARDIGLVKDTLEIWKRNGTIPYTKLFISGALTEENRKWLEGVASEKVVVEYRRLDKDDFNSMRASNLNRWYICAGKTFQNVVSTWLDGRETITEDFSY